MGLDEATLKAFVIQHETNNSIERILKTTFVQALPEGENYTSVIWRVACDVILKSGRRAKIRFIVKEAITTGHHGQLLEEHGLFKREIEAYQNILQQMHNVMEVHCDYRETQWAELIGCRANDLVILQDLTAKGYRTVNRKEMLDLPHALLLVRELGRFHAMGLAVLQNGSVNIHSFSLWEFGNEGLFRTFFLRSMKAFSDAVENSWGAEWKEASKRIRKSIETAYEKYFKILQVDSNRFNVINHGDCWSNNIMFKWDDQQAPTGVKFLDFQLMHYNSFAMDLTYLMYNSIQPDVRRGRHDDILTAYKTSLERNINLFGVDVKVPNLDEIKLEMSRLRFFGYLFLCTIHAMTTAEVLPLDMEKMCDKSSESTDSVNQAVFTSEKFKRNMTKDLIDFMKEGVI